MILSAQQLQVTVDTHAETIDDNAEGVADKPFLILAQRDGLERKFVIMVKNQMMSKEKFNFVTAACVRGTIGGDEGVEGLRAEAAPRLRRAWRRRYDG